MKVLNLKLVALLAIGSTAILGRSFAQEAKQKPDSYSAVAIGTGGSVGGRAVQFDFNITSYTTDQELDQFAQLLKEKGTDALVSVLGKQDKGSIRPTGRLGDQIAIARKRQVGKTTIITIVTARNMSFLELYRSGRTVDYPFGLLQVTLDEKGESTGKVMAAAKIRFDKKKGIYDIESYGNQYIRVTNVRPWD
jgi:hypothetical protein